MLDAEGRFNGSNGFPPVEFFRPSALSPTPKSKDLISPIASRIMVEIHEQTRIEDWNEHSYRAVGDETDPGVLGREGDKRPRQERDRDEPEKRIRGTGMRTGWRRFHRLDSAGRGTSGKRIERVCDFCAAPLTKPSQKRFCNHDCYGSWMSVNLRGKNNPLYKPELRERTCEVCGGPLTARQAMEGNRFCSHKCQGKTMMGEDNVFYKPEIHKRACEVCGKPRPVQNGRFCSGECHSIGVSGENSHNWIPELHEGNCEICGNPLIEVCQTRCCSNECRVKLFSGSNHPSWRGGLSFEPYGLEFNNILKERIRNRDNHKCQYCGISESEHYCKLNVHHINYIKTDNQEANLISLCKKCHSKTNTRRWFWESYFNMKILEKNSIQSRLHLIPEVKEYDTTNK